MYKQSHMSYHIAECGSFKELLDLLKKSEHDGNGPIVSHSRTVEKEHSYDKICKGIKAVRRGLPINYITRAMGLRAKVAELVMANNYGDAIPEDLNTFEEQTASIVIQPYNLGDKSQEDPDQLKLNFDEL